MRPFDYKKHPLRFGDRSAVQKWEDEVEMEELRDGLEEKDIFALTDTERHTLEQQADSLLGEDFAPARREVLEHLYPLIFDDEQEPREGMEALGEAYQLTLEKLGTAQDQIHEITNR